MALLHWFHLASCLVIRELAGRWEVELGWRCWSWGPEELRKWGCQGLGVTGSEGCSEGLLCLTLGFSLGVVIV